MSVSGHLSPQSSAFRRSIVSGGHQVVRTATPATVKSRSNAIERVVGRASWNLAGRGLVRLPERMTPRSLRGQDSGLSVFIGHGSSPVWRELKDFLQDRLAVPWDEFNRVSTAGMTNVARLTEMLDGAAIALLVLTAEDERLDGSAAARQNVVHEAGLFQGRLGFSRAILLLEDDCEQFSNIDGLGQIRFSRGKIAAVFEDVRRVLEREGVVTP